MHMPMLPGADPGDPIGGALPSTTGISRSARQLRSRGRNHQGYNDIDRGHSARRNAFSVHIDPIV